MIGQKAARLNNFQAQETAKYCLNLSQGALIGGISYVVTFGADNFEHRIEIVILAIASAVMLYLVAIQISKEVKI